MEYTYTLGRRKTSVATIRLYKKNGKNLLNDKAFEDIYIHEFEQVKAFEPFLVANLDPVNYYFTAKTNGGGKTSQLEAIRLALARAISKLYPEKKKDLKTADLLTRDPRMVESKKPGLRKARRAEQYSKR